MDQLALHGGPQALQRPLTGGRKWGLEELREVLDVFESGCYYRYDGRKVTAFEAAFAEAYGVRHAVASTSGTAAIHVALGMLDPEPGSEVIIGPITDLGSVVPVLYQQCIPVFADTDPRTFCMDPADIERRITERTVAIMPVHLFGNPCDMDAIMDLAERHQLVVIEDCSQAHYTRYKGRLCGTIGHIGAFSLQAGKHITTGEGGVTITSDDAFGERGSFFQDKGWARQAWGPRAYLFLALNYRMSELQGAVGLAQLRRLTDVVARRHANGSRLTELLAGAPGLAPQQPTPGAETSYWLYGLAVEPDGPYTAPQFAEAAQAEGLSCGAGYIGKPIFLCAEACAAHQTFGSSQLPFTLPGVPPVEYTEETCPRTAELLQRMLTLPMSEFYSEQDIEDLAGALHKVARGLAQE